MTKRNTLIWAILVSCVTSCTMAAGTFAQEPIRVQSNEVLVPVFVADKERVRALISAPEILFHAVLAGDAQLADKIMEEPVIRGLTAGDFKVFDDGKERVVRSVTYEQSLYWDVRDNGGHHTEYIGPGGGKWSTIEWPSKFVGDLDTPHYLIAFALPLPESPEGSCHQIKINVNRPNAFVSARREYCNTNHSPSDPVNGTKLGGQLESVLAARKDYTIDVSVLAIALYSRGGAARIHISLEWPWKSLKGMARTKGVLGMLFRKDGSLVTRFSDLADRYGVSGGVWTGLLPHNGDLPEMNLIENRYDGQVELPPGEYQLRVAIGDGTRFGIAQTPLTVDSYDQHALSISSVSLCKQISDVSANARKLSGAWKAKPGDYVPLVSNDMEFKPTSNTRLKAAKNLYVYFEIYEPLREAGATATVEFQIRTVDLKTGAVVSDLSPISASPYAKPGDSVIPIGRGIDIRKLPKGTYRLDVRASDSTGKSDESRPVNFTVE